MGVAIVGCPVSHYLDNGLTLEVTRLCTTGKRDACSMLYAAAREAKAIGYRKIITYTMDTEDRASIRATGPAKMKLWYEKLLFFAFLMPVFAR